MAHFIWFNINQIHIRLKQNQQKDGELKRYAHQFFSEGYVILKDCISSDECKRYMKNVISPTLAQYKINLEDAATWTTATTGRHKTDEECIDDVPVGIMVRGPNGSDPIQNEDEQRWKALFECNKILSFLDYIHGGKANWRWLHDDNVGWIHLRFPILKTMQDNVTNIHWHVDGGHFDLHKLNSLDQSVIALPMMQDVNIDGGNTLVIPKSHTVVMRELWNRLPGGLDKKELNKLAIEIGTKENGLQAAPCKAGDVLIMHPFLVHAASRNTVQNPVRISFNMGTCWTKEKSSLLQKSVGVGLLSPLEDHIIEVCGPISEISATR